MKWPPQVKLLLLLLLIFLITGFAAGQNLSPSRNESAMTEIVAVWRRTIAKAMHLTPRQSETFWPLYDAYQQELRDISEQRALWLQDIAGRQDLFSEETAGLMIQDYLDMENQRVALKRSTLKKFGQVLPARAVLKFIQLEIQIESGYYEDLGTNLPVSQ